MGRGEILGNRCRAIRDFTSLRLGFLVFHTRLLSQVVL